MVSRQTCICSCLWIKAHFPWPFVMKCLQMGPAARFQTSYVWKSIYTLNQIFTPLPYNKLGLPSTNWIQFLVVFLHIQYIEEIHSRQTCATIITEFPRWLSDKESTSPCRGCRLDPWVRKSPWRRNGNPLQCSCLGNPMDWWAIVHVIAESNRLSN